MPPNDDSRDVREGSRDATAMQAEGEEEEEEDLEDRLTRMKEMRTAT